MALNTIEAHGQPVLVISAGEIPPLADFVTTRPDLLKSLRSMEAVQCAVGDEVLEAANLHEIDEALEAWLGEDLVAAEVWNGERDAIHVRQPTEAEVAAWEATLAEAVRVGDQDAGDRDWVAWLPPASAGDAGAGYDPAARPEQRGRCHE